MNSQRIKTNLIWLLALYSATATLFIALNSTKVKALWAATGVVKPTSASAFQTETYAHLARRDRNIQHPYTLFLGDSLTQAMPTGQLNISAENFGVGGDTSQQILARLSAMQSLPYVRHAIIMAGTNDLNQGLSNTADNLQKIIQSFQPDTRVTLLAIPPVGSVINHISNTAIRQLNSRLEQQCQARPLCQFINSTDKLSDTRGDLDTAFHIGDGIHLNHQGYAVLLDAITHRTEGTHD